MAPLNLIGKRFGRLFVIRRTGSRSGETCWLCVCDCKQQINVTASSLKSGNTKSCGCFQRQQVSNANSTHRKSSSREYTCWSGMKQRCFDKKCSSYRYYGNRGITVCKEWLEFENFYRDMGDRPAGMTLERKDNNKGYSKDNCIWATYETQANNKRNNILLSYNGVKLNITQWSKILNIPAQTIRARLKQGWSVNKALSEPNKPTPIKFFTYRGETKRICDFAKQYNLDRRELAQRIRRGWSIERALEE